jgi:hypothetical protein
MLWKKTGLGEGSRSGENPYPHSGSPSALLEKESSKISQLALMYCRPLDGNGRDMVHFDDRMLAQLNRVIL